VDFYKEFPIEMDVVGRYHDLGHLPRSREQVLRIINVDNLAMNGNQGGGDKTIRASFTATTFVYDDKLASGEAHQ
jgi:Tfp pilus assembly protein PilO